MHQQHEQARRRADAHAVTAACAMTCDAVATPPPLRRRRRPAESYSLALRQRHADTTSARLKQITAFQPTSHRHRQTAIQHETADEHELRHLERPFAAAASSR